MYIYIYIYYNLYIHIYTLWTPLIQTWLERSLFYSMIFLSKPTFLGDFPASHLADSRRVQGTNSCSLATLQFVDVCCLPAKPFLKWAIDMVLSQKQSGEKSQNPVVHHGFRKSRPLVICGQFWPFEIPNFQTYPCWSWRFRIPKKSPVPWVRRHCSPPAAQRPSGPAVRWSDMFSLAKTVPSSKVSRKKMAVITLMTWMVRWVS